VFFISRRRKKAAINCLIGSWFIKIKWSINLLYDVFIKDFPIVK